MSESLTAWAGRLQRAPEAIRAQLRAEVDATIGDARNRAVALARQRLRVRTGDLVGSIRTVSSSDGLQPRLVGTAPYFEIQEEGGVVRPRRGPWLNIPVPGGYRRVREVRLRGRHMLRDGFSEATAGLGTRLDARVRQVLEGAHGE